MNLVQLQQKADLKFSEFFTVLSGKEDAYFAKHGTYFGFKWTPATPVVDGVDTDFGELQRPSRFHVAEDVSFNINDKVPFQVQVIRHHGDGHGYTLWVRAVLPNGDVYMKSKGAGQHFVDTPWYKFIPNPQDR